MVDFLSRNIDQIEDAIDEAAARTAEHQYGQPPPHGFYSVICLAETRNAIPPHDPAGLLDRLKARVAPYSEKLRASTLGESRCGARSSPSALRKPP